MTSCLYRQVLDLEYTGDLGFLFAEEIPTVLNHQGANFLLRLESQFLASNMASNSQPETPVSSGSSNLENRIARMADPNSGTRAFRVLWWHAH